MLVQRLSHAMAIKMAFLVFFASLSFSAFSQFSVSNDRNMASANESDITTTAPGIQVQVVQADSSAAKFRISIINPDGRRLNINIKKQNDVLFTESTRNTEYSNVFDMDQLEDGQYAIEIISGKDIIRKDIMISTITRTNRVAIMN